MFGWATIVVLLLVLVGTALLLLYAFPAPTA